MLKKGDRVSCKDGKEGILYGVVDKGGSRRITMILDGGKLQTSGRPADFTLSDHPLAKDEPNIMDRWSIKSYKEFKELSEDTEAFSAKICLNGKPVIEAKNQGFGGPNEYYGRDHEDAFYKDAKAWAAHFGDPDMIEAGDIWIFWYTAKRPYGVTAKEYIEEGKAQMEEWKKKDK